MTIIIIIICSIKLRKEPFFSVIFFSSIPSLVNNIVCLCRNIELAISMLCAKLRRCIGFHSPLQFRLHYDWFPVCHSSFCSSSYKQYGKIDRLFLYIYHSSFWSLPFCIKIYTCVSIHIYMYVYIHIFVYVYPYILVTSAIFRSLA